MKVITYNKEVIIKSLAKMVNDKNLVSNYLKAKTTIEVLNQKGIKLANPL